ncbi:MAG: ECF transporter S component [Clostridiales bacterium]|nr:ECF transporter S component [Clostridiales bacterium]
MEEQTTESQSTKQSYFSSTKIAFIAMFATIAAVLYILNFSIPFAFPGFLEFKFSDVPILIGAFTLGPVPAAAIVVVEILIKLVIKGSTTFFVGELSDLITSCTFAVTAGIIYKKHRTFKGALVAMAVGTVAEVAVAILFNWLVLVPFYVQVFFGGNWQPLVGMMKPLFPSCTKETFYAFYLWVSVLPFNLLRCIVASLITTLVYKHISRLINSVNHKIYGKQQANGGEATVAKINVAAIIVGAVVVALLVMFALLRYFVF